MSEQAPAFLRLQQLNCFRKHVLKPVIPMKRLSRLRERMPQQITSLDQINFRVGSVDDATASADLVCANLTADVISRDAANAGEFDVREVDTFRNSGNADRDGPGES